MTSDWLNALHCEYVFAPEERHVNRNQIDDFLALQRSAMFGFIRDLRLLRQ